MTDGDDVAMLGSLPMSPSEVTLDWLRGALAPATAGCELVDMSIAREIEGTADKLILDLEWDCAPGPDGPPTSACLKAGFRTGARDIAGRGYINEARFYDQIAPQLPLALPRCWYAGVSTEPAQGIVILDDLTVQGCRFGDPFSPISADLVATGLEKQAAWHAATWGGQLLGGLDWLPIGSPIVQLFYEAGLSESLWDQRLIDLPDDVVPEEMTDRHRIRRGLEAMVAYNTTGPLCLLHGDGHLGNIYVDADDSVGFVDWQIVYRGRWAYDVAYFIVGSMDPADRRAHERDLLVHYADALAANGVPRSAIGDVWEQYRREHLHGFMWAFLPAGYPTLDWSAVMGRRYATAALDHDTLGALRV